MAAGSVCTASGRQGTRATNRFPTAHAGCTGTVELRTRIDRPSWSGPSATSGRGDPVATGIVNSLSGSRPVAPGGQGCELGDRHARIAFHDPRWSLAVLDVKR